MALGTIAPVPIQQIFDANGYPLVGGTLTSYLAGSSTLSAMFSDPLLTIPHPNPITIDAAGRLPTLFLGANTYKFVLKDAFGAVVWTADNIASNIVTTEIAHASTADHALVADNVSGTGAATVASLVVSGAVSIGTTLSAGASTLASLVVSGAASAASLVVSGASTLASLVVSGAASAASLAVSGASTLASLTVSGASALASLVVTGAATVGTTLGVTGNATVGGTLGVTGTITAPTLAGKATSAGHADTADSATRATDADHADDVTAVGGHPVSDFALLSGASFSGIVQFSQPVFALSGLYEYSHAYRVGEWALKPFDGLDFTNSGSGGAWSPNPATTRYAYMRIGNTLWVDCAIITSTISAAPTSQLKVKLPAGLSGLAGGPATVQPILLNFGGAQEFGFAVVNEFSTVIDVFRLNLVAFPATPNLTLYVRMTCPVNF